ncbi:MAG: molybdopterin dinucleotide binding domain-containing protein [Myxococcota bacterium]
MALSRRTFLKSLGAAGVSASGGDWLLDRLHQYAVDRLSFQDVRGPGLESFSRSVCRDCPNHCSLSLRKIDQLPVGLRGTPWHPASQGSLCAAGQSQMQALFDPLRLATPLVRSDAGAEGHPAAWEEALGLLGGQLRKLVAAGAGDRLAVVDGRTPSLGTRLVETWVRSIPGARYIPLRVEGALDQLAGEFFGGAKKGRLRVDLAHSGTLLLVGDELLDVDGSPVSQMRAHGERREHPDTGAAPTLYLGPRQGATAAKSDAWIPSAPGQERDILLGLAQTLSEGHPQRSATLARYARWVPEARDPITFARRFAPENLGLRAGELELAARALRRFAPGVVLPGPALLRRVDGAADVRAALALNLWTGGFRERGGLSWASDPLDDLARALSLGESGGALDGGLPEILQPLFEIRRSPVDVLICIEANLVHELPGQDQIARAISHVPFVATFASRETHTALLSHVTLPTLLDLESWDLPSPAWGVPDAALQVQRPAMVPVVEARAPEDVLLDLAKTGSAGPGFAPPAPTMQGLVEKAVDVVVRRGQGELVERSQRNALAQVDAKTAKRELLSGEAMWLAPQRALAARTSGQAVTSSPPARPPALAPRQLWLVPFDGPAIRGGRVLDRPMLMEIAGMPHGVLWESWVELHPIDAHSRGMSHGDRVKIRGPRAEIEARVVVTRSITPGSVAAPLGFGLSAPGVVTERVGGNPLKLPYALFDATTGAPTWGPIPVFLEKA